MSLTDPILYKIIDLYKPLHEELKVLDSLYNDNFILFTQDDKNNLVKLLKNIEKDMDEYINKLEGKKINSYTLRPV